MFETAARDVPKAIDSADEAMLDGLQRAAFDYFLRTTNLRNGLVADTTRGLARRASRWSGSRCRPIRWR
jgi:hypothetical protein